jgi:hypothetical protein
MVRLMAWRRKFNWFFLTGLDTISDSEWGIHHGWITFLSERAPVGFPG